MGTRAKCFRRNRKKNSHARNPKSRLRSWVGFRLANRRLRAHRFVVSPVILNLGSDVADGELVRVPTLLRNVPARLTTTAPPVLL
jgi:hypothetical protein